MFVVESDIVLITLISILFLFILIAVLFIAQHPFEVGILEERLESPITSIHIRNTPGIIRRMHIIVDSATEYHDKTT